MSKFKVGDYLVGNEKSREAFTRLAKGRMLLGRVSQTTYNGANIKVEIIESTHKDDIGTAWTTSDLYCFDLSISDPFEAYLRGQISEKEYKERLER